MSTLHLVIFFCVQQIGGAWTVESPLDLGNNLALGSTQLVHGPDVDLDGFPEILVADSAFGDVYCLSAQTAAVYWRWWTPFEDRRVKAALGTVPDVNGDGIDEVLIGSPYYEVAVFVDGGRIYLVDGRTGTTIRHHDGSANAFWSPNGENLGYSVLGVKDMDGDGRGEYLAGAPFSDRLGFLGQFSGVVYCWSGATGSLLWMQSGQTEELFGLFLSNGPDLTNDGRREVLVGSPSRSTAARPQGLVAVLDGSSGATLYELLGSTYLVGTRPFGSSVVLLPDLDEDGQEDIFVGASSSSVNGIPYAGEAFIISGRTSNLIWTEVGTSSLQGFGSYAAACADVDEDGIPDLAISAPSEALTTGGYEGRVYLHSGVDGFLLGTLEDEYAYTRAGFGSSLLLHKLPGRDEPLLLIGESQGHLTSLPSWLGILWPYTFSPFLRSDAHELSAAAGGDVRFRLDFPSSEANQPYAMLVSGSGIGPTTLGGIQVPLATDAWFWRSVQGSIPPLLHRARGVLDVDGDARAGLRAAPSGLASQVGRTLHFAAVTGSGGSLNYASIAVSLQIKQ